MKLRIIPLALLIMVSCDHDEAVYPVVHTADPPQLGTTTAVIEGNITATGSVRPIKYGFIWDTVSGLNILTAAHRIDLGATDVKRVYQVALDNLSADTEYFVRAYTANAEYSKIYYGNEVAFKTLP